jgi:hypothetical protein
MRIKVFACVGAAVSACALAQAATGAQSHSLVGRWQTVRTCRGLAVALRKNGLGRLAPAVVGDYFPNKTPAELAKKKNLCQGAKPQRHSHFFTSDGKFGSLEQHGQQVDDGTYQIVTANTVKINDGTFRFRIKGKTLMLTPRLTADLKQKALADPLAFSTVGWMVAVSYVGHPWRRVPCGHWC